MIQFESIQVGNFKMAKKPEKSSSQSKKSPSAQKYGAIYRQFTRVKFAKYKLQFPRLRESQIITKIIRQWEAMDEEAKDNIEKQFIQRSGTGFLKDESSSSKKRREREAAAAKAAQELKQKGYEPESSSNPKKKKKISPKVRVFQQKSGQKGQEDSAFKRSDEGRKSGKKSTPDKDSDSVVLKIGDKKGVATKQISKSPKSRKEQYLSFFKYYYERLASEHPRWTKMQISTIIKLLWRKRAKAGSGTRSSVKGLSGRQLYRRIKESEGYLREQIKQMWKSLPHESKKYWVIKAQGRPHRSKRNSGKFVRRVLSGGASSSEPSLSTTLSSEGILQKSYSWMDKTII